MSTNSAIAVMESGIIKAIYCHWDGYLEHNGRILQEHYNEAKANELISLGDLSILKNNIGVKHAFSALNLPSEQREAFEREHEDSCTFYGRDRNEIDCEHKTFTNLTDFINHFSSCEYYYVMIDGVWKYTTSVNELDLKSLPTLVTL